MGRNKKNCGKNGNFYVKFGIFKVKKKLLAFLSLDSRAPSAPAPHM